jgi:hypothetical protein
VLDLHSQEELHVLPVRLVRVGPLQMGEYGFVFEFWVGEEVIFFCLGFGEQAVLVGKLVFARVADADVKAVSRVPHSRHLPLMSRLPSPYKPLNSSPPSSWAAFRRASSSSRPSAWLRMERPGS